MEISNQAPLTKERQQTDDSLTVERGKTDESFETYKGKTESETDKAVSANRLEADKARFQRRSDADVMLGITNSDIISEKEQEAIELRLLNERKMEDTAVEKERSKNDLAIELERDEKERLLNKLVSIERQTTDKNLFGERAKTDLDAELAIKLLNVEQVAHLNTKSALTTREEFVAIVSHDLKNPIGTILSSAEMLMEDTSMMAIGEDAKRWIDMIKRNAQTSLRLIGDILDMERIVEGKINLQIKPFRIDNLIREAVESHAYVASAKRITLKASEGLFDGTINGDSDRVAQILSNLIGNALKFTPDGGSIKISAEEIENEIKISVEDTGPGIPENQKNRIFERFAQIGNKSRSGLGLGLYISKTLVESHQGKLWVTSSTGNGSIFHFTLPKT